MKLNGCFMTPAKQRAADEAIVLAALPGNWQAIWHAFLRDVPGFGARGGATRVENALLRLKRKGIARYVRETSMWERVP